MSPPPLLKVSPAARCQAPFTLSDTDTVPLELYWANQPTRRSPWATGLVSLIVVEVTALPVVAGRIEGVHRVAVGGARRHRGVAVGEGRGAHRRERGPAPVDGVAADPHVVGGGRPAEVDLAGAGGAGGEPGGHAGRLGVARRRR